METGLLSAITKERVGGPWQEELAAVLKEVERYFTLSGFKSSL